MQARRPNLVVIAGPNGAGKSTVAPTLLRDTLAVEEFVNADLIAQGLSGFDPQGAAVRAGRVMLRRLHELARARADFAFESTLASRSLAAWISRFRSNGYRFQLVFLRGLRHFFGLYRPLAESWVLYDNSQPTGPRPVASGQEGRGEDVIDEETWKRILASAERP